MAEITGDKTVFPRPESFKDAIKSKIFGGLVIGRAGQYTIHLPNGRYVKTRFSRSNAPKLKCVGAYMGKRDLILQFKAKDEADHSALIYGTTKWTLEMPASEALANDPNMIQYLEAVKDWEIGYDMGQKAEEVEAERDIFEDYAHIDSFGKFA